jgi:hypothetical protein
MAYLEATDDFDLSSLVINHFFKFLYLFFLSNYIHCSSQVGQTGSIWASLSTKLLSLFRNIVLVLDFMIGLLYI